MKTTLDLPDPLFKAVKTRAVQEGVTLKQLLATYIEAGLRGSSGLQEVDGPIGKVHPLPVGIPRVPGTPLHPAMTNAELQALLTHEDLQQYQRAFPPSQPAE